MENSIRTSLTRPIRADTSTDTRAFVKPVNAVHKVVERRNAGEITDGESGDDSQYRIVSEFFASTVDRNFEMGHVGFVYQGHRAGIHKKLQFACPTLDFPY
jgi:hypothetical protein